MNLNNLDKWNNNINKLKKIKTKQPNSWQYMQNIVDIFNMQNNNYTFIDNHGYGTNNVAIINMVGYNKI